MLDVAEHCFIRMAETLIERGKTARQIFTKYSIPEQFPDGTVLELLSPVGFLEGVKEAAGIEDLSEMEAACLLRVLAKPELDNAIILNEFTMIMENFGVPDGYDDEGGKEDDDDDDDFDDYIRDEDYAVEGESAKDEEVSVKDDAKPKVAAKPKRRKIVLNFTDLEEKGHKILKKLARFLLERYMHPREFYGPAIYRQMIKIKTRGESHPVDILHSKDFYARMKAAGVRKAGKENESLNKFLRLDAKFPHLMQMKKVVKALEEVAQIEQKKMQEEIAARAKGEKVPEEIMEESEEDDEEEQKASKKPAKKAKKKGPKGPNMDLLRETGMNDYFVGASKPGSLNNKMAMLMGGGFTHLNTIEEEKHETQTSNYFREAGAITESEREYDSTHIRGSKILDDDVINSSSKVSPNRLIDGEFDFPQSSKHHQTSQQHPAGTGTMNILVEGSPSIDGKQVGQSKKPQIYDEDEEEEDEDEYEEDIQEDDNHHSRTEDKRDEDDISDKKHGDDEESDYEF